ncbi:hypothetical protein DC366_14975 [Pelagivirga sediminicola]|uniref:Excalibur calcium-binding domain-containing protein n=1 Tax=Pelagivirga sediminicola TaxID=2170575 RepID=A0A2T7G4C8_9RHOB|nr:hypothetical protein [Pelagivirga sediminicola]PVA09257.1 hypothetical protein DC366_14975 [Pelagivirga sediminicola]
MRFPKTALVILALPLALAACGTSIPDSGPDSGAGVGFGSYSEYEKRQAARDAQLAGNASPAPNAAAGQPLGGGGQARSEADELAAQTRAALGTDPEDLAANSGRPIVQAGPGNPAPQIADAPGISVENNFDAVSSRRSIEDDAARVAEQRRQYQVAQVQSLPSRTGGEGPNIAAYALSSKHAPGTQVYRRGGLNKQAKFERNCAAYPGPDLAQIAFLEKGGPERDRLGLDPDGDGYACDWDPRPFRKAAGG